MILSAIYSDMKISRSINKVFDQLIRKHYYLIGILITMRNYSNLYFKVRGELIKLYLRFMVNNRNLAFDHQGVIF